MTKTIAVAGKGGTGKTSVAALLVEYYTRKGLVLAVDADPATNLNQALGLPLDEESTVGRVREKLTEDVAKGVLSPTITKQDYMFGKMLEGLVESKGFDLLAMGRPEGPGCYCAPNEFLRTALERLVKDYRYKYVVMDCEAGMEHISRRTTGDVDALIIMSDPTIRGITVAGRIKELIAELRSGVGSVCLVLNRVRTELSPELTKAIEETGLQLAASIPEDEAVAELEMTGRPVTELPADSRLRKEVEAIALRLNL